MDEEEQIQWPPPMSPKQLETFNFKADNLPCSMPPALLLSGPRESGKTLGALHLLTRHLWQVDGARAAIIGKTIKNVKEAGVVKDLTEHVLPIWIRARLTSEYGAVFNYTSRDFDGNLGPKVDGSTKTWFFRVRNYWGTESELLLYSLDHDDDVEDKLKNTRFSCIYFPELDRFKNERVFTVSYHQLRMLHLPPEQHLWLADTNPAEEGVDHFAYRIFYETQRIIEENPEDAELYKNVKVIEMLFSDNPWLSPQRIAAIRALYRHDPDLWSRFVEGKWIRARLKALFADVFMSNVHVIGDAASRDRSQWEVIVPDEQCHELITGWDMGDVNHAAHILTKRMCWTSEDGKQQDFAYDVIDELVHIRKRVSIEGFTLEFLELMEGWEAKLKELYGTQKILWRHWSDDSAWNYRSAIDAYDELIVRRVSMGKIMLGRAMRQKSGSVKARVKMVRKLLFENRLFISAKCPQTIDMFKTIDTYEEASAEKHPLDSLSYALAAEEPNLVEVQILPPIRKAGRIIRVAA